MARTVNREQVGKGENGRYTEEFKQQVIKCIEKGMNSSDTATKLGVEPLGSGYRQLFYKLQREYRLGENLPTMHAKGLSDNEKNTADSGIKNEGAVLDSKAQLSRQIITRQVSGDIRKTSMIQSGKKDSDKNNTSMNKVDENVFSKSQKNLAQDKTNIHTVSAKVNRAISIDDKKDLVQDKIDTPTEHIAKVGGGMSYENNKDMLQKKSFASTEVSSEFMDDIVNKYKESINQGKGVDYLLGSIDSKIEALKQEVLSTKQTISFLSFLRNELVNLNNKEA